MLTFTPTATIVHLGLFREKVTLQPVEYYSRLPSDNRFDLCYILDPLIATGGTTAAAVDMIKDWGVQNIRIIAVNASRAGLQFVHRAHPNVKIFVGAVDGELSEAGEIIPGVGDAGDRLFNSVI
jgi:uracil phosphoribosyltransferase